MKSDRLQELEIDRSVKQRSSFGTTLIFLGVIALTAAAAYFAWPRKDDDRRVIAGGKTNLSSAVASSDDSSLKVPSDRVSAATKPGEVVLTVSGYIINRERIELSPRFMGVVEWIEVKKGDSVTNGQVIARLDDSEYKARLKETDGRLAAAKANLNKAEIEHQRISKLVADKIETQQAEDNARLNLEAARAGIKEIEGQIALLQTYLDWTVIRSPINGVVLEKLVDPKELVSPQSFGGARGPSTAFVALADPKDLQVEIDLNEADLSKVSLNQPCRVSPEAYPDRSYEGYVAEIAPEANRQKGTLQIKVQIRSPDRFLTPELSAKVDFLSSGSGK